MKRILVAIVAMAFAPVALAQNTLTRAQEGRVMAAQCWASCSTEAEGYAWKALEHGRWIIRLSIDSDLRQFSDGGAGLVELAFSLACDISVESFRAMDACYQACTDIERAYGNPATLVKSRFRHAYLQARSDLRTAGLWNSYNNSPESGTPAFARACDRFTGEGSNRGPGRVLAATKQGLKTPRALAADKIRNPQPPSTPGE